MGIISVENTDRLYWLGRYTERVYTTIKVFESRFDSMIDIDDLEYEKFCESQDIPNIYKSKEDFVARYCFSPEDGIIAFEYDSPIVYQNTAAFKLIPL